MTIPLRYRLVTVSRIVINVNLDNLWVNSSRTICCAAFSCIGKYKHSAPCPRGNDSAESRRSAPKPSPRAFGRAHAEGLGRGDGDCERSETFLPIPMAPQCETIYPRCSFKYRAPGDGAFLFEAAGGDLVCLWSNRTARQFENHYCTVVGRRLYI